MVRLVLVGGIIVNHGQQIRVNLGRISAPLIDHLPFKGVFRLGFLPLQVRILHLLGWTGTIRTGLEVTARFFNVSARAFTFKFTVAGSCSTCGHLLMPSLGIAISTQQPRPITSAPDRQTQFSCIHRAMHAH